ncbi:GNAT family N-acetyltransferase [Fusobacterium ulcerans]|uniref:GNAT family N-acetyltransferase n=1 Tax=Fusobacterium ulcerans TaxID=861 RepID=UPI002E7776AE|nr:GNAT family N-acetyltransferase [Fusobacterium ulcerans]MEE0139355.1 GNAT family N-acetyltransferase [Fusobacterium ulcerans]
MNFIIREYKNEDLDFIVGKHWDIYSTEYGYVKRSFYDYVKKTLKDFLAVTKFEREKIWIAEAEGKPIGAIALIIPDSDKPWEGQLRWFIVEKEYRKYGIGRALMDKLLEFAEKCEYKHIFLWTASNLGRALSFYNHQGFYETDRFLETEWCDEPIYEIKLEKDI